MTDARRAALIVANDHYDDRRLRRLRAPASDAEELARVLGDPSVGGFEVEVSQNEPEHVVRRRLSAFFDGRRPDDVLLVHLSCHGVKDEDGQLYFAMPDTEVDHLEATAIPSEFVNRQMTRSRSRRILLLLDCCYSGAFARGVMSRGGDQVDLMERFDGRGRIVLTASSAMEYSFEGDTLAGEGRPSVFTSAVVDGLGTGAADRNGDGYISVDELYDYAYDRVRAVTPSQTPGKWVFDVQGDFYVARSPAPRTPHAAAAALGPQDDPAIPGAATAQLPTEDRHPAPAPSLPPEPPDPATGAAIWVGALLVLAAAAVPLLAHDLERWNAFAALSPIEVLLLLPGLLLLVRSAGSGRLSAGIVAPRPDRARAGGRRSLADGRRDLRAAVRRTEHAVGRGRGGAERRVLLRAGDGAAAGLDRRGGGS